MNNDLTVHIKDVQGKLAKLYSIILLETKWMKQ